MKHKIKTLVALLTTLVSTTTWAQTADMTIRNDQFWNTVEGEPIYSQGGGIFRFIDPATGKNTFFWYGAHYREAEQYRQDPSVTLQRDRFVGVTLYTSDDLVHWHSRGHVLTAEDVGWGWTGRLGVAYIEAVKKYALVVQHNKAVLFALSDSPLGPFQVHKQIDMTDMIGTPNTGDQTVFTDDNGKSYLVYSYGNGRNRTYISEIGVMDDGTIGLLDCHEVFKGESREGNCMFKHGGKYYLCASNIYGWDGSLAYYLVSDHIYGPYLPTNDMQVMQGCEQDYAHVSQTGFFTYAGDAVIFCGDRWAEFAGNGLGYNQWVPLTFDEQVKPVFHSLSAWELDATNGRWRISPDNNYILNGSFEADRRIVPIAVKPRQDFLRGWETRVLKGNTVSADNPRTPHLNYDNTREDRKQVIGEHALCISDSIAFEREVSQIIPTLPDGNYILSFKMRQNGQFKNLKVEVDSSTGKNEFSLKRVGVGSAWTPITLPVSISGGTATLRFYAKGKKNAQCLIDDVTLSMSKN